MPESKADVTFPEVGALRIEAVYEYYDEPVLFCANGEPGMFVIVLVAATESSRTWLLTPVTSDRRAAIERGDVDLNEAFSAAEGGKVLRATVGADGEADAAAWVEAATLDEDELPLPGTRLQVAPSEPKSEPAPAQPAADVTEQLLDNTTHRRVADALTQEDLAAERLRILTSEFSLFAFDAMRELLDAPETIELLFSPAAEGNPPVPTANELLGGAEERALRNKLTAASFARECAEWAKRKADVRGVKAMSRQNIFIVDGKKGALAVQGGSTFTAPGLGLAPSARAELSTSFRSKDPKSTRIQEVSTFFDRLYSDPERTHSVKTRFLAELARIHEQKSPQLVYFTILHALFSDTLDSLEEEQVLKTRTGIKNTVIWRKLYRFQRDAVIAAVDKIERYNGCIIADSVGLGKTFEALAIIKYYELRNDRVLVLCPKKLRDNWTLYTVNDKRNLLAADRFSYDVLNHTDLTRTEGKSGEIDLASVNWGNYDLVVIDESHNFRNNPSKSGMTRYRRLMNEIIKSGVKTRVLMLSATPVNSRMNDLKNQVAFITEGKDHALEEANIQSIERTLQKAQKQFNAWLTLPNEERTTSSLLRQMNFDYFLLLDLLTIARSRKHIEKYYNLTEVGEFPRREKPINIRAAIDSAGLFPPLHEVNRDIRRLNLSAYAPTQYILPHRQRAYADRYDIEVRGGNIFRQESREQNLIHLMRVNLLKRMESSINSFAITVDRLRGKVEGLLGKIDSFSESARSDLSIEDLDDVEIESDEFDGDFVGTKVRVALQDMDLIRWRQDLEEDLALLAKLARISSEVDASRDVKLARLKEVIEKKLATPLNPGNKKVIVFTAFADTADYLYAQLAPWATEKHGIHSAAVSGQSASNKTTLKLRRADLSAVLTAFSPISKERDKVDPSATEEIDLLIATDCISEGQNLQDADYVVNYDIHWNPVRIIQRFGRIDRLGSQNEAIQLVNFWPNMELDEYINLEARVSGRMVLLDISATGEENIIEQSQQDEMRDLEYRRRQFEQLQESVIDLEEISGGISITDLTLTDYKVDLGNYLKHHQGELESMPLGVFSVAADDGRLGDVEIQPGAFFCLRAMVKGRNRDPNYALGDQYLIYVSDDGEVVHDHTETRRILDLMKKVALGRGEPDAGACRAFDDATSGGKEMGHYTALLDKALKSLKGKEDEVGVQSLFSLGAMKTERARDSAGADYEVVGFLVVCRVGGER